MGETLATNVFSLDSNSWYLVSHGDWLSGSPLRNDYENGLYMPLSSRDLLLYKPRKAFLDQSNVLIALIDGRPTPCFTLPFLLIKAKPAINFMHDYFIRLMRFV